MRVISHRADKALRFHVGEQITVEWRVPRHHSRRDWIGLYRVGANQSSLVTRTSSLGIWVPVHDKEWDGDTPIGEYNQIGTQGDGEGPGADDEECGMVVFKGDRLPWMVGQYEIRYHHDGKYNVLALEGPIEIVGASVFSFLTRFAGPTTHTSMSQWTAPKKSTLNPFVRHWHTSSPFALMVTRH